MTDIYNQLSPEYKMIYHENIELSKSILQATFTEIYYYFKDTTNPNLYIKSKGAK